MSLITEFYHGSTYTRLRPPAVPLFPVFSFIFLYFENLPLNSCEKLISPLFPLFLSVLLPLIPVFSFFCRDSNRFADLDDPEEEILCKIHPVHLFHVHFWFSDPIMYSFGILWFRCYLNFVYVWSFSIRA